MDGVIAIALFAFMGLLGGFMRYGVDHDDYEDEKED